MVAMAAEEAACVVMAAARLAARHARNC